MEPKEPHEFTYGFVMKPDGTTRYHIDGEWRDIPVEKLPTVDLVVLEDDQPSVE